MWFGFFFIEAAAAASKVCVSRSALNKPSSNNSTRVEVIPPEAKEPTILIF